VGSKSEFEFLKKSFMAMDRMRVDMLSFRRFRGILEGVGMNVRPLSRISV
jgi:hypothetical protein